jgi:hypothetical protein
VSLRLSSPECGRASQSVRWLQNVDPRESAHLLRKVVEGEDRSVVKKAINALALHQGTADDLIEIARHEVADATAAGGANETDS